MRPYFSIKAQELDYPDENQMDFAVDTAGPGADKTRALEEIKDEWLHWCNKLGGVADNHPNEKYVLFSLKTAMLCEGNEVPLFLLQQFSVSIRLWDGCVVKTTPSDDPNAGGQIGGGATATTIGAWIFVEGVEGILQYYTVSDDQIRVYWERAR